MQKFSLRDTAGNLNLFAENVEFVKINIFIYQSIGNDEKNLMICSDLELVQNLKSYSMEKIKNLKLFGYSNFSGKTCSHFQKVKS